MGLMDRVRGELVDIIEWIDDSRSTMAWRFPRYNNEIKNGAQLIVREGQEALFVYRGRLADRYGPGHYELISENMPIMSTLQGWQHGFKSPFRSEVYFVNHRPITDLRWGTPNPITIRDPDFGMVQVRANGLCVVRVVDAEVFLREVIGTDSNVDADEIAELLRRTIATAFSDMLLQTGVGAIDLQGRQVQLADQLRQYVQTRVQAQYGITCESIEMNISLPDEITAAMTRGVARGVEERGFIDNVGDMNRFQQGRAGDAMLASAQNPGGGTMGDMMAAGMGMAMAQQFGQNFQGDPQQGQWQQGQQAPPPLPGASVYHVDQGGQAAGPFPIAQLRSMGLTRETLVWAPTMPGWAPAGQVAELAQLFHQSPPPLPGHQPPEPPAGGAQ
ncbi:SPFH domain-containing protein [Tsukamurella sp. 8F]|uniref:SPFH domain-containing protein n=1 Tax=unclassified Tsukamurella TaxID=2633480 RepID=UPI0023B8FAD2|nr:MULTISPECIES: SPFH domain-containing protein [unclassified Tsukamurella]MDF0528665.1 SPFH domain-containing protein [Tsukamurella sp. 8J]MDF0585627.1 SPFH domain-containing protein [Tsukamurella sp. 8F]